MKPRLEVDFCGVRFPNPFTIAASPPSDTRERVERAFAAGWGGAVLKTTSLETETIDLVYPMMGTVRAPSRRNAGFVNIDLLSERHIDEIERDIDALKSRFPDHVVIGSIMARGRGEWEELVHRLEVAGADMIECSQSCPQGDGEGVIPAADPDLTREVTGWIRDATRKDTPIIVKLTPNVTDVVAIARAAAEGGADAVCGIDTVRGMAGLDLDTLEPLLSVDGRSTWCGVSGPAIKPMALGCVSRVASEVPVPVAGVGGIWDWSDAAEFLLLGATTVQVCTAIMQQGMEMIDGLCQGLSGYMESKGFATVDDMVGHCLGRLTDHESLSRENRPLSVVDRGRCRRCHACQVACRDGGYNAIALDPQGYPAIDPGRCRGCGLCLTVCPVPGCLHLEKRGGA